MNCVHSMCKHPLRCQSLFLSLLNNLAIFFSLCIKDIWLLHCWYRLSWNNTTVHCSLYALCLYNCQRKKKRSPFLLMFTNLRDFVVSLVLSEGNQWLCGMELPTERLKLSSFLFLRPLSISVVKWKRVLMPKMSKMSPIFSYVLLFFLLLLLILNKFVQRL